MDEEILQEEVSSGEAITLQAIEDLNQNIVMGDLGIITCLGFVFGALVGSIYANITR